MKVKSKNEKRKSVMQNRTLFKISFIISAFFTFSFLLFPLRAHAATIGKPSNNLGLVGYWSLDDNRGSTATDFSGNGHTGTLVGSTWTNGKLGKALSFNGSGEYVDAGNIDLRGSVLTLSAWVKPNAFQTGSPFISSVLGEEVNGVSTALIRLGDADLANNKPQFVIVTSGESKLYGNSSIATSTWTHLAATYDGSVMRLYINGVQDASSTCACGSLTASTTFDLAANPNFGRYLNGSLDEARVYKRVLSASEISALYSSGAAHVNASVAGRGPTSGLIGHWTFDGPDIIGATSTDRSGQGNDGSVTGSPTPAIGKIGQGLYFNGTGQRITMPTLNLPTISLAAWINVADISDYREIFNNNNDTWSLRVKTNSSVYFTPRVGGIYYESIGVGIALNTWYYFVGTYDGETSKIYVNGELAGTDTSPSGNLDTAGAAFIGTHANGSSNPFFGTIDDARIYNRALTQAEIIQLYRLGNTTVNMSQNAKQTSGLIGLWSFDGPDMTSVTSTDRSGQGNDGTLLGSIKPRPILGKIGQGLLFNGSTSYINLTSPFASTDPEPVTFCAWFKANSLHDGNLVSIQDPSGGTDFNNVMRLRVTSAGNVGADKESAEASGSYVANEWTHACAVFSAIDNRKIYVNGALSATETTSRGSSNLTTLSIGARALSTPDNYFNGTIDDVRVYNRALTASEVATLYRIGR